MYIDMSTRQEPPPYQDNQTAFIQPQAQNDFIPPSKTVNSLDAAVNSTVGATADVANFQLSFDMSEDMFGEDIQDQVIEEPLS